MEGEWGEGSLLAGSLVQVGPVIWAFDVDPAYALYPFPLPLFVLIQVMGASSCPACGF